MSILVAIPFRKGTDQRFIDIASKLYWQMTYADRELAMWENEIVSPISNARYSKNADARNMFLDRFLEEQHTHVLWVDCDIVQYPKNIIELLGVGDHAAAPSVLIEGTTQFYDYGGFVCGGKQFNQHPPYTNGDVSSMDSVGSLYIIPAKYYRIGCRYDPTGCTVEHISMFACAKSHGLTVMYKPQIVAYHANSPKWGHSWH